MNRWGCTPLFLASCEGHVEVVRELLEAGADPEISTEAEHVSPLMEASWQGHQEVVELLLQQGLEVNARDNFGRTALWRACYSGFYEVAQLLLLERRTDFWMPSTDGRPPMQIVQERGDHMCQRLLQVRHSPLIGLLYRYILS
jgi:hypothetical protein